MAVLMSARGAAWPCGWRRRAAGARRADLLGAGRAAGGRAADPRRLRASSPAWSWSSCSRSASGLAARPGRPRSSAARLASPWPATRRCGSPTTATCCPTPTTSSWAGASVGDAPGARAGASLAAAALTQLWAPVVLAAVRAARRAAPGVRRRVAPARAVRRCSVPTRSTWAATPSRSASANRFISAGRPAAASWRAAAGVERVAASGGAGRCGGALARWRRAAAPGRWPAIPLTPPLSELAGRRRALHDLPGGGPARLALGCACAARDRAGRPLAAGCPPALAALLGLALVGRAARRAGRRRARSTPRWTAAWPRTACCCARRTAPAGADRPDRRRRPRLLLAPAGHRPPRQGRPRRSPAGPTALVPVLARPHEVGLRHSVGRLRPDVVGGRVGPQPRRGAPLRPRLGYDRLAGGADLRVIGAVYVRRGSTLVDAAQLDRRVSALFPPR